MLKILFTRDARDRQRMLIERRVQLAHAHKKRKLDCDRKQRASNATFSDPKAVAVDMQRSLGSEACNLSPSARVRHPDIRYEPLESRLPIKSLFETATAHL